MVCPEPPKIEHGMIQDPQNIYLYNQSVRYECDKGFALIGKNSIHCAVKDTQLAWSSPHPVCRGKWVRESHPPWVSVSLTESLNSKESNM